MFDTIRKNLLETNGDGLFTEAAAAKHETVLADQALSGSADAAATAKQKSGRFAYKLANR